MNEYVEWLVTNYRQSGILIDSNILLLLVIGSHDPSLVARFKRTERYAPDGFVIATEVVARFDRVITLHSVLAEVSNLTGQLTGTTRSDCLWTFGNWIHTLYEYEILGTDVARLPQFPRFGLTDSAIIHVAARGYLVFTDDFPLAGYLIRYQLPVLSLSHLREETSFD